VLRNFFALKNPTALAGFEPANLGTKGQHATPRPPKLLHWFIKYNITHKIFIDENYTARTLLFHVHRCVQGQAENNRYLILFEKVFADNLNTAFTHPLVPTVPAPPLDCHHTVHCQWN
jgi:hypothetical protein